jgi:hypothetical protein
VLLGIDFKQSPHVLGKVQHHRRAHRLAGQARAPTAGQHRHLVARRDLQRRLHVVT